MRRLFGIRERRLIELTVAFCVIAVTASWAYALNYSRTDSRLRRQANSVRYQACQRATLAYKRENLIEHRQELVIDFLVAATETAGDPTLRAQLLEESDLIKKLPPVPIPIPDCTLIPGGS